MTTFYIQFQCLKLSVGDSDGVDEDTVGLRTDTCLKTESEEDVTSSKNLGFVNDVLASELEETKSVVGNLDAL